jgi:hypothetical protein
MFFFSKSLEGLKYSLLAGPELFTYIVIKLPNGRTKKLIIMGETHTPFYGCGNLGSCVTMTDYISQLGNQKCIDIFIEDYLKPGQGYLQTDTARYGNAPESNISTQVMRKFTKKLSRDKRFRIQNWDLRMADNYGVNFIELDDQINDTASGSLLRLDKTIYFKYFLGYQDVTDRDFNQFLQRTPYKVTRKLLTQASILRKKVIKEYNKFKKTEHEYFPKTKLPLREFMLRYLTQQSHRDLKYMSIVLTDFYTLLRMFRTFGNKRKGSCIGEPYSDRIVYYAGSSHSKNILTIIKYYFPNSIKCQISSPSRNKIISFDADRVSNTGRYRSFSDFIEWPN